MIISDTRAFAFFHVPKCAGTSVRSELLKHDTRNNYYWMHKKIAGATEESEVLHLDKAHLPLSMIKAIYPDTFQLFRDYTTFAISRHPKERLISAFFEPRPRLLDLLKSESPEALQHIQSIFHQYVSGITSNANFLSPSFVHATPQHQYHIHQGKVLTDAIIRIENPKPGIARLNQLNSVAASTVELALDSKQMNKKHYHGKLELWLSLPQELRRRCAELYQADCELLGYSFDQ